MKRILYMLIAVTLIFLCRAPTAEASLTYGLSYYRENIGYLGSGGSSDPLYQFINEVESGSSTSVGTGNAYYCDPNVSNEGDGGSWTNAKNTLNEAIGLCTSNNGDVIYVAQDSTFTMGAAADEVDADVGAITIVGCGEGSVIPTFNYTGDVTGAFAIGVDDITIINCRFTASAADVNEAIEIEAGSTNLTLINCIFDSSNEGTYEFHECINQSGAVADGLRVINCEFRMGAGAARSAIAFRDADYAEIKNCLFAGDYAVADINNATTASNHIVIHDNVIYNGTVGGSAGLNAQPCIELKSDTSGIVCNNVVVCNVDTPDAAIVAADCFLAGNVYSETEGGYDAPPSWLTTDSALNIFGYNDSDNAVSTSSVSGNASGSMLERLAMIDNDINDIEGTVDSIATADSNVFATVFVTDFDANSTTASLVTSIDANMTIWDANLEVMQDMLAEIDANATVWDSNLETMQDLITSIDANATRWDANEQFYWQPRVTVVGADEVDQDLMDIQGGPIFITKMMGIVTVEIGGNATTASIMIDRDDTAADTYLTTKVNIESDPVGAVYVFSDAAQSVLTPLEAGDNGSTNSMGGWFVPEGMLEQDMSADPGGAAGDHITWYITWYPLTTGVTCVAQ